MNEQTDLQEPATRKRSPTTLPFLVTLIGVLILVIALFLPYMSASGELARRIQESPDWLEDASLGLTRSDFSHVSLISVSKIITAIYSSRDGAIAKTIIFGFCGLLALTALFVILKKPIAVLIFELLTCSVFLFLNSLMKSTLIGADHYVWGVGYYAVILASIALIAGSVWLLIVKSNMKRHAANPSAMVES